RRMVRPREDQAGSKRTRLPRRGPRRDDETPPAQGEGKDCGGAGGLKRPSQLIQTQLQRATPGLKPRLLDTVYLSRNLNVQISGHSFSSKTRLGDQVSEGKEPSGVPQALAFISLGSRACLRSPGLRRHFETPRQAARGDARA